MMASDPSIERAVPLSAGAKNGRILATAAPRIAELEALAAEAGFSPDGYAKAWRPQLGSLGSGNHFIEVSVDEQDRVVEPDKVWVGGLFVAICLPIGLLLVGFDFELRDLYRLPIFIH